MADGLREGEIGWSLTVKRDAVHIFTWGTAASLHWLFKSHDTATLQIYGVSKKAVATTY